MDKKTIEVVKKLTSIIVTGGTHQQIADLVMMQGSDLRDAVKAVLLRDIDEQCKSLCKKSDYSSSVLRVPRSKHKVEKVIVFLVGI